MFTILSGQAVEDHKSGALVVTRSEAMRAFAGLKGIEWSEGDDDRALLEELINFEEFSRCVAMVVGVFSASRLR